MVKVWKEISELLSGFCAANLPNGWHEFGFYRNIATFRRYFELPSFAYLLGKEGQVEISDFIGL